MSSSNLDVGTRRYLKRREAPMTRQATTDQTVVERVRGMLEDIEKGGEAAALKWAKQLDKWEGSVVVSKEQVKGAAALVGEDIKRDIRFAHARIKSFAEAQRASMGDLKVEVSPGYFAGHKLVPVGVAGAYVPGGRYAHIASALMTVTTAKAAGVPTVIACSAPRSKDGIHPAVLYAFDVAGADHVLCLGGVQALAAMAYGLFTGKRCDMLVGPGNSYVVEAKRALFGHACGIDMIAGPTEVAVLADKTADPFVVATDLVSQGEHGPDSPCVCVTTDAELGAKVKDLVPKLIADLPEFSRKLAEVSWRDFGEIIAVDTREEMAEVSDEVASEHLEVQCADLGWWHGRLRNYGSLFMGEEATVSGGDKCSGPNHVLPTRSASRWTGGLYVGMFIKTLSFQYCTSKASEGVNKATAVISREEGMEAHARSGDVRLDKYGFGATDETADRRKRMRVEEYTRGALSVDSGF